MYMRQGETVMRQSKSYAAIDNFRLAAALLIVAIHTAPLESFSSTADFLVTYCFGRIAVPFFLMVTGFFVLAPYQRAIGNFKGNESAFRKKTRRHRFAEHSSEQMEYAGYKVSKFLKKTAVLYGIATILYLPVKFYSGQISLNVGGWLKELFFDGTFYHLWYLPAVLMGCLLLIGLMQVCNPLVISFVTVVLYIIGMLGDSYYQLVSNVSFLKSLYEGIFKISSYTRNGIFFAPVFLWMGVVVANGKIRMTVRYAATGFAVSMAGMLAEGFLTYTFQWQKHNSMYLLLLPVMFFLFGLLLTVRGKTFKMVRDLSMCVYIIHPLCIVLVRGIAKIAKLTNVLVEQSFIQYLCVCVFSVGISFFIAGMFLGRKRFGMWMNRE